MWIIMKKYYLYSWLLLGDGAWILPIAKSGGRDSSETTTAAATETAAETTEEETTTAPETEAGRTKATVLRL